MDGHKNQFHCDECSQILMATPSGGVCPDGHGRIRPHITERGLRKYKRHLKRWKWLMALPVLTPKNKEAKMPRLFYLDGKPLRRATVSIVGVKRTRPRYSDPLLNDVTVARFGERPMFLRAVEEKVTV